MYKPLSNGITTSPMQGLGVFAHKDFDADVYQVLCIFQIKIFPMVQLELS